jgi:hypothetical protein
MSGWPWWWHTEGIIAWGGMRLCTYIVGDEVGDGGGARTCMDYDCGWPGKRKHEHCSSYEFNHTLILISCVLRLN